jgi:hypothetical protein
LERDHTRAGWWQIYVVDEERRPVPRPGALGGSKASAAVDISQDAPRIDAQRPGDRKKLDFVEPAPTSLQQGIGQIR